MMDDGGPISVQLPNSVHLFTWCLEDKARMHPEKDGKNIDLCWLELHISSLYDIIYNAIVLAPLNANTPVTIIENK